MQKIPVMLFILICFTCCYVSREKPIKLYAKTNNNIIIKQCSFPILYAINKNIPKNKRELIHKSFKYWDQLTDKNLFQYMGLTKWRPGETESDIIIVVGLATKRRLLENKKIAAYVIQLKYWNKDGCIARTGIFIFDDLFYSGPNKIKTVLRHEIGHVLGFIHSNKSSDLMYSSIENYLLIKNLKRISNWELKAFELYYK